MPHATAIIVCLSAAGLAGCAFTDVDVAYTMPGGAQITATYTSTKDIEAPTFVFKRGPDGTVQEITVGAGSSLASPVIEAQGQTIQNLGSAIGAGVAAGLRGAAGLPPAVATPRPELRPSSMDDVEQMLWQVQL